MGSKCFSGELLLTNPTGSRLYHSYAEGLPIVDYHCHLEAREICENREFKDLGEMWLAHDHYKWRAMRTFGISEEYITGKKSYHEKYLKFAWIMPYLVGNPLLLSTTEDPADSLEYHMKMKENTAVKTRILTAFRPDRAFYCEWKTFPDYMKILSKAAGQEISDFSSLMGALEKRLALFAEFGTTVSDNGIAHIAWEDYTAAQVEDIFRKAAAGERLSREAINRYKSAFLIEMAKLYKKYNFVMQLHIGTYLDANHRKVREIGQSTGFDCVDDSTAVKSVGQILDRLTELDHLPKTILYPLNPAQMEPFAVLAAGFCDGTVRGKVQLGAPWWFNDQPFGIMRQFGGAGNLYPLSLSVGMLTDSRSFLSYPRHELYRRCLCSYLGELVERGEYFSGEKYLKEIIEGICYRNVKEYFGW